MIVLEIIVGLLILVLLVVVHELGHAIVAYRNGVVVEEFGIGFPPRAWKKKLKNGVLFTLNWLPLGGFVKMQGENDAADKKGDYGAASFWAKTKILFAGVFVNWLVAAMLLTILAVAGLPKILPNQFSLPQDTQLVTAPVQLATVVDGSPAAKAGLKTGDQIVRFDGQVLSSASDLTTASAAKKGKTVEVIYSRGGKESTTRVTLRQNNDDKKGYLGVGAGQSELIKATWSAPIVGVGTTAQFTWETLKGVGQLLGNLFSGVFLQLSSNQATREAGSQNLALAKESVGTPISIVGIIFPAAERAGLTQFLFITAIISLTLAVMNALPIPALDGGRWFITALFKVIRQPLTKKIEERIVTAGFVVLMALFALAVVADVGKIIS